MDPKLLSDWLVPASTVFTLITVSVATWLSLREFRLKLIAETRLRDSARIESDVQLLRLFVELMDIAHARGACHVSEKAVERLLDTENVGSALAAGRTVNDLLSQSVVVCPVGLAAQNAAIATIAELGKRHDILKASAIQGLESLSTFKKEIAERYLEELRR